MLDSRTTEMHFVARGAVSTPFLGLWVSRDPLPRPPPTLGREAALQAQAWELLFPRLSFLYLVT